MLLAARVFDAEAPAQRIEIGWRTGVLAPCELDRVDRARGLESGTADAGGLGVDEADIEAGVVNHQRRIGDEVEEAVGNVLEQRLVGQELADHSAFVDSLDDPVWRR